MNAIFKQMVTKFRNGTAGTISVTTALKMFYGRAADTAFFETLVRLHRETEGFPYTGLKKGGNEPAFIGQLESALAAGTVDDFARLVGEHSAAGIKAKFAKALEAKKRADGTPVEGRAYVVAYVDLMHYTKAIVEAVHASAGTPGAPHGAGPKGTCMKA